MITLDDLLLGIKKAALHEWQNNILDRGGSPFITSYFDTIGWHSYILPRYKNLQRFAWCGVFAGYCGLKIGGYLNYPYTHCFSLKKGIAHSVLPSTFRISQAKYWNAAGVKTELLTGRAAWESLKPGSIATVKTRDSPPDRGGHIVIVDKVRLNEGLFDTIEGNAYGELGSGKHGEGVIRRRGEKARRLEEIAIVPLLTLNHFEQSVHYNYKEEYCGVDSTQL